MRYAHVTMDLNKELPKASVFHAATDEIKDDVSILAMATSGHEFAGASRTLREHWGEMDRRAATHKCLADADLEEMWSELRGKDAEANPRWRFNSWHRYKELRGSFYELKKSHVHPGYLCCTCPVGIKDELCKHALLLMETEEMISPLPRPLEPRKKRGRKKKVGRAWERV